MSSLTRQFLKVEGVTVGTTVGGSQSVPCESYAGGIICIPGGTAITELTVYVSYEKDGDFYKLYDHDGEVAKLDVINGGTARPIPVAAYGAFALKLVGDAAGTVHVNLIG